MRGLYIIFTFAFAIYSGWKMTHSDDPPFCSIAAAAGFAMAALHAP